MTRTITSTAQARRRWPWPSKRRQATLLLLLGILCTAADTALAASREQAIASALQQAGGGKVLAVRETQDASGQAVYEVKVINNGRVRVITVPAG